MVKWIQHWLLLSLQSSLLHNSCPPDLHPTSVEFCACSMGMNCCFCLGINLASFWAKFSVFPSTDCTFDAFDGGKWAFFPVRAVLKRKHWVSLGLAAAWTLVVFLYHLLGKKKKKKGYKNVVCEKNQHFFIFVSDNLVNEAICISGRPLICILK